MPVRMRLTRMGKKKQPHYRVVVADSRAPRDGRYLQAVGYYSPVVKDPETGKSTVKIDPEQARDWLRKGAQPTDRVRKLLKIVGVLDEHDRITAPPEPTEADAAAE